MGLVWNELQPKLGCLFGSNNELKSDFWDPNLNEDEEIHSWQWGLKTGGKKNSATALYHIVCILFSKTIFLYFEFSSLKE